MKIFVAYCDDSPPHAAYASEELFDKGEANKDSYIKELEVVESASDVQEKQIHEAGTLKVGT